MTIKILGVNVEESSVGMIIDSAVNITLFNGQTWTVPANKYAKINIHNNTGSGFMRIGDNAYNINVVNSAGYETGGAGKTYHLGPGTIVRVFNGNTFRIIGTLFANG